MTNFKDGRLPDASGSEATVEATDGYCGTSLSRASLAFDLGIKRLPGTV